MAEPERTEKTQNARQIIEKGIGAGYQPRPQDKPISEGYQPKPKPSDVIVPPPPPKKNRR